MVIVLGFTLKAGAKVVALTIQTKHNPFFFCSKTWISPNSLTKKNFKVKINFYKCAEIRLEVWIRVVFADMLVHVFGKLSENRLKTGVFPLAIRGFIHKKILFNCFLIVFPAVILLLLVEKKCSFFFMGVY